MLSAIVRSRFLATFGATPLLVSSPGRINLIGEHTDYNEGFVLPAAIDKAIYLAFAKNGTRTCHVYSLDYQKEETFSLDVLVPADSGWVNYIMGVVAQLLRAGYPVEGFDCVFGGDIPIGAGLSSSAALENGVGLGLSELFGLGVSRIDLIKYSQQAEHEFAGVKCGIMDMFASMMGKADQAIRLDCRSLDYAYFPIILGKYQLLLLDTRVEHSLGDSAYNTRREECIQGVAAVQNRYPGVKSLRDVTLPMLEEVKANLVGKVYERCSYVVEENQRLLDGCEALEAGDLNTFGQAMYGSHAGLSGKYEVSCPELDFLVDFTQDKPYVLGARMMGGGFGGCTLNLLESSKVSGFIEEASASYREAFDITLKAYKVTTSEGTHRMV